MSVSKDEGILLFAGLILLLLFLGYIILECRRRWAQCELLACCSCCGDTSTELTQNGLERRGLNSSSNRRRPVDHKAAKLIVETGFLIPKVGSPYNFKISLPEDQKSHFKNPNPSITFNNLGSTINIEIKKVYGLPEFIPFIHELESNEEFLRIKFTVKESGLYAIYVKNAGEHITNSPFRVTFKPTTIDPEKTQLIRSYPTIIALTDSIHKMMIEPKDRFENACEMEDFNLKQFSLSVAHMDESFRDQPLEDVRFRFSSVGILNSMEFGGFNSDPNALTSEKVQLIMEILIPGYFRGKILYQNKVIGNGAFNIVSLTSDENTILAQYLKDKASSGSMYHEGKLIALNQEVFKKVTTVYVYVTKTALTVKEYYFGFVPVKLATYKILPVTKIELLFINSEQKQCTFTIHDRVQPKLTIDMDSTSFRILLALFAHSLHTRLGGSASFDNKQKFFSEELRKLTESKDRGNAKLTVYRDRLVDSSFGITKNFSGTDWYKKFQIEFFGEEGHDDGGLRKEWIEKLCVLFFEHNPEGMFCCIDNSNSRFVHPNPKRLKKWTLKHYEFAGKIVGKCLFETSIGGFNKQLVNGRFTRSFLAQIIGLIPQCKHFEQDDPELFISKVKYLKENDVDTMDMTFVEEEYTDSGTLLKTIELVPNGKEIKVTNDNKEDYLNALAQYRLGTKVQKEVEAFVRGLNEIIPEGLLTNFDENELELLMCGKSTFNTEDLKQNFVLSDSTGISPTTVHKTLEWFWASLDSMTGAERGKLLQFTTGSSLLPHGGFKNLQPSFRLTVSNTVGKLPIAHTCFSELCLSKHETYEAFNKSLLLAINECTEGFALL